MESDVFLSHASEEKSIARDLRRGLEERGVDVWMAPRDIPAGAKWPAAITTAVESTTAVLFLTSEAAFDSDSTLREIQLADECDKPIVPLRLEDAEPVDGFRFLLMPYQWVDVDTPLTEEDFDRIAQELANRYDIEIVDPKKETRAAISDLEDRRREIATRLSVTLENELPVVPPELDELTNDYLEDVQTTLESQLEPDERTTATEPSGYLIEFSADGEHITTFQGDNQTESMKLAADYLIRNEGLLEEVGGLPWVPGESKAILNDTTDWEQSAHNYHELDSGVYLDANLSKRRKQRVIDDMASQVGLNATYRGDWD